MPMSRACSGVRQTSCTVAPDRASSVATAVPQLPAPTTTGWRIGCWPPSHSHWSEMHDHTRLEISCASDWRGSRSSGRGKVSARPQRTVTRPGRISHPRRRRSVPRTATGTTGAPVSSTSRPTPRFGSPSGPGRTRVPSGKMPTTPPRSRITRAVSIASSSDSPRRMGNAPSASRSQAFHRLSNSSTFATKCSGRPRQHPIMNGSAKLRWFEAISTGPALGTCSSPIRRSRKYRWKKGCRIARTTQ